MVAPAVAAAAIQVGGNILGGLFGNAKAKRERQQAIDDQRLQYVRLREAAELAGFNPLAVLGNAAPIMTPQVVPSTDYMGSAIADSAMLLAQNLATSGKAATAAKLNQYQTQNSRLQKQVENLTLRPDVPGVYARKAASAAAASGGGGGGQGSLAGVPSLAPPTVGGSNGGLVTFGVPITQSRNFSDAEDVERRYGELAAEVHGLGTVGADARMTWEAQQQAQIHTSKLPPYRYGVQPRPISKPTGAPIGKTGMTKGGAMLRAMVPGLRGFGF